MCHRIALTADIEKAFLHVSIKESNHNFLSSLWLNGVKEENPSILQDRFHCLAFGSKPSPLIPGATIHKHVNEYRENYLLVLRVLDHRYVNDVTRGSEGIEDALKIYHETKEITNAAGNNLRKWNMSCKDLLSHIKHLEGHNVSDNEISICH